MLVFAGAYARDMSSCYSVIKYARCVAKEVCEQMAELAYVDPELCFYLE